MHLFAKEKARRQGLRTFSLYGRLKRHMPHMEKEKERRRREEKETWHGTADRQTGRRDRTLEQEVKQTRSLRVVCSMKKGRRLWQHKHSMRHFPSCCLPLQQAWHGGWWEEGDSGVAGVACADSMRFLDMGRQTEWLSLCLLKRASRLSAILSRGWRGIYISNNTPLSLTILFSPQLHPRSAHCLSRLTFLPFCLSLFCGGGAAARRMCARAGVWATLFSILTAARAHAGVCAQNISTI